PFGYLELPIAVFFGWFVFHEFPDKVTWVGISVLVASGLYILHRERVVAKKNPTQTPLQ
ncbi:MAG: DMT family transporter, partial [Hyphomicrobiales bacterium]|nr:DMT family transporter [Hyphomicrobiales bacterium]